MHIDYVNCDLFELTAIIMVCIRWYQIKITMRWEDDENGSIGTPSRVVQYEGCFSSTWHAITSADTLTVS